MNQIQLVLINLRTAIGHQGMGFPQPIIACGSKSLGLKALQTALADRRIQDVHLNGPAGSFIAKSWKLRRGNCSKKRPA